MKEATMMAGKLILPNLSTRTVNSNRGPKQATSQEMERAPVSHDRSPPKKRKPPPTPSTWESADFFEATTAGASQEVSVQFSKLAQVLSERAAADTSLMKQLDSILVEARNLESYLKEKKNHLRQMLTLISDKLQG